MCTAIEIDPHMLRERLSRMKGLRFVQGGPGRKQKAILVSRGLNGARSAGYVQLDAYLRAL